jgi:hypothetical protein
MGGPLGGRETEDPGFVLHDLKKTRKSRKPMQAERSPSRRISREELGFFFNPVGCGVLSASESGFVLPNLRERDFSITQHFFSKKICRVNYKLVMPPAVRLFHLQTHWFSFCGIRKSLPN